MTLEEYIRNKQVYADAGQLDEQEAMILEWLKELQRYREAYYARVNQKMNMGG